MKTFIYFKSAVEKNPFYLLGTMNLKLRIPDLFFSCRFTLFSFILIIEKPQKCLLTMVMIKQTSPPVSTTLRCLRVRGVVGRRYKTCTITVNIVGNW